MATQTTGGGSTTSFTKAPQAGTDGFCYDEEELAGYSALLLDVMANDLGGNAKILWSVDDGTNDTGAMNGYVAGDLLTQDQLTSGVSQWQQTGQGSWIRIDCGKVEYRLGNGTDSNPDCFDPIDFDSLPQGPFTDTFIYAIRMANGTLSWATVTVNIQGANDAPTVTALTGSVGEDGPSFSEDLLSGTADVDAGTTLGVVDAEASLTTDGGRVLELGTHYTVTGSTFALTAAGFALFNNLPQGVNDSFVFDYGVSDGIATTPNTLSVTVTGTNDVPTVTALSGEVVEDGPAFSQDLLSGTADVDAGTTLGVVDAEASLTTDGGRVLELGTHYTVTGSTFALTAAGFALFNNLPQGVNDSFVFDYGVSDGIATTPNTLSVTVTGTNDVPTVTALSGEVVEDGPAFSQDLLSGTADVDAGTTLGVVDAEASLTTDGGRVLELGTHYTVTGSTFALTAAGFALFNNLPQGVNDSFVFDYGVSDGIATTPNTLSVTVTGTNDDAVITAVADGDYSVTEAGGVANAIAGDPDAAGQVSVSDVDDGEESFETPASLAGTYGTFTFDPDNGQWTYQLNNDSAVTQALNAGPAVTDTLTVTSLDGSDSHDIVVNITGTNDAAVIAGDDQGEVTEEGAASPGDPDDTGTLTAADVDNAPNTFQASAGNSTYGSFTINASGQWAYTLNNAHPALATLAAGLFLVDSFVVHAADGTAHTVEIQINGADDVIIVTPPPTETGADPNDFDLLVGTGPVNNSATIVGSNSDTAGDNITGGDDGQDINGRGGDDFLYGGGGGDTITGGNGNDTIYGQSGVDIINGNNGLDAIYGGSGSDQLTGGNENDTIFGGSGDDTLIGLNGDDILIGGYGADMLTGGGDNDTFRYLSTLDTNDLIFDFMDSGNDQIDLSAIDADPSTIGNQAFVWGGDTPTAHGLWFEQLGDDTVLYADTDGNAATAEFMVTLSNFNGFGSFSDPLVMPPDITP